MNTFFQPGKALLTAVVMLAVFAASAFDKPAVHLQSTQNVGPRDVEPQTETGVVRDYIEAWRTMDRAFSENNTRLLDADFIGLAKEKLAGTIKDQAKLGLRTSYQDRKHDISFLFYSPEGMSLQLVDNVEYDVQIIDHDKVQATQHVATRYIAVLTPTEVRWKVRIFQAAQ